MSKCQARKLLAGGRSVGSGNPICGSTAGPPLDAPLAALLAARDAQDRQWSTTATAAAPAVTTQAAQTAIVLVDPKPSSNTAPNRDKDIQAILDGDF
jgi:hypothetical protein